MNHNRALRRSIGVVFAGAALVAAGIALGEGAAVGQPQPQDCNGVINGDAGGSLVKHTVPAGGTQVSPGDSIAVTATWDPTDWTSLNKIGDCMYILRSGSVVSGPTSVGFDDSPPPNSGSWIGPSYTVPTFAYESGDQVCDRVGLSGTPSGANLATQKSATVCFPVQGESTTSSSTTSTTAGSTTTSSTTTSTTEAPTTTTSSTTTSTTSTTVAPTTTTVAPTSTTQVSVAVEGTSASVAPPTTVTVAVAAQNNAAVAAAAQPNVLPAQVAGEQLPRTGFNARLLVLAGLFLMGLGGSVAGLSRIAVARR